MSGPNDDDRADGFLARWSRRKVQTRQGELPLEPSPRGPPIAPPFAPVAAATPAAPAPTGPEPVAAPVDAVAPAPPPTLDDVTTLTAESDFSRFVAPGVDGGVRNAALKKLFTNPHFNIMDGLDTYIDDYGKPNPLPPGMLEKMAQSKFLGLFTDADENAPDDADGGAPDDRLTGPAADAATADSAGPSAPADVVPLEAPDAAPTFAPQEPPLDENADLRLQPHDAAGRTGPASDVGGDAGRQH